MSSPYQLSNEEGGDEKETRAFEERNAPRTSHKDQGLADCADLKVNCRRHHLVERIGLCWNRHVEVVAVEASYIEMVLNKQKEGESWTKTEQTRELFEWWFRLTGKKSVSYADQKNMTVIRAM